MTLHKKNSNHEYLPDTPNKVIQVDLWKAVGVVAGAVLVSIVGTAFTVLNALNTDHFTLGTNVQAVERVESRLGKIENTVVSKEELQLQLKPLSDQLLEIKQDIREVKRK